MNLAVRLNREFQKMVSNTFEIPWSIRALELLQKVSAESNDLTHHLLSDYGCGEQVTNKGRLETTTIPGCRRKDIVVLLLISAYHSLNSSLTKPFHPTKLKIQS
ncbi:hypothetical protein GQX74_001041 [Glossina fuscipes]|nr:hypothetical protein GQX74_001041 [Glossina fuscipes]